MSIVFPTQPSVEQQQMVFCLSINHIKLQYAVIGNAFNAYHPVVDR